MLIQIKNILDVGSKCFLRNTQRNRNYEDKLTSFISNRISKLPLRFFVSSSHFLYVEVF